MATIRYPTPIKLGEFHTIELHRNQTQGTIIVDREAPVNGSSQVLLHCRFFDPETVEQYYSDKNIQKKLPGSFS